MKFEMDSKDKRKITKDWESFFPDFKRHAIMHIIRRNGPFFCGISLRTTSAKKDYQPEFHVTNQMVQGYGTKLLTALGYAVNSRGIKDYVVFARNEKEWTISAERLKQHIKLLQQPVIELNDLVSYIKSVAYREYSWEFAALRDIVLAYFWFDKKDKAEKELIRAKEFIATWPENATRRFNGAEGWEKQVRELMNRDLLQKTVEEEIIKHKLEKYQDYGFIEK